MELSRQTIRLIVEFRKRLVRHGVVISLTSRDAPLELLNASSGIADELIQHYRERLLKALPPVQRVYFKDPSQEPPTCMQCGRTVRPRSDPFVAHYMTCLCGQVFRMVMRDERAHPRYPIHLPGVYSSEEREDRLSEMFVEDVSYGGVRLRSLLPHNVTLENRLIVRFTLDDADRTLIREVIRVCDMQECMMSGQFVDPESLNHALVLYLGTKWVKARATQSPSASGILTLAALE